jgi:hypothetical protein
MNITATDSSDNTDNREDRESRDWLRLMPLARELAPRIQIEDEQTGLEVQARSSVRQCLMRPANGRRHCAQQDGQPVEISLHFDGRDLRFRGLFRCGCGWACPVCAARQAQENREAVARIIEQQAEAGRRAILALGTVPHCAGEALQVVYERKEAVLKSFLAEMRKRFNGLSKVSYIVNNETTHHWVNSWHPHSHFIFFIPDGISVEVFCKFFCEAWSKAAERLGLAINPQALQAEEAADVEAAARYVTKADRDKTAAEMACGQNKTARRGHLSPFQMLEKVAEYRAVLKRGERLDHTDWRRMKRLEELYSEYVNFYHGRVRKLSTSRDIKLREPVEQAAAEQANEQPAAPEVAVIEESGWTHEAATNLADLRDELRQSEIEDWYRTTFRFFVLRGAPAAAIRPGAGIDPADWLRPDQVAAILAARDRQRGQDELDEAAAAFAAWQMAA